VIYEHELLRTGMNMIHQQGNTGLFAAFQAAIVQNCDEVLELRHDEHTTEGKAWHRAALATKQILRSRDESVKAEWLAAYAELPPMEWPGGSESLPVTATQHSADRVPRSNHWRVRSSGKSRFARW